MSPGTMVHHVLYLFFPYLAPEASYQAWLKKCRETQVACHFSEVLLQRGLREALGAPGQTLQGQETAANNEYQSLNQTQTPNHTHVRRDHTAGLSVSS